MSSKKIWGVVLILALLVLSYSTRAQEKFGFLDHNGYYDSRGFSTYTLNTLWKSNRFQWFSLSNFNSNDSDLDFSSYYSEFHCSYSLDKNEKIGINQLFVSSSLGSDALYYGLKLNWHKILKVPSLEGVQIRFFTNINTLGYNLENLNFTFLPQIEYVYWLSKSFGKNKPREVYINGFADQNINKGQHTWVTEHQIGFEMVNSFYAIIEYRYNQYLADNNNGLAAGLQYLMKF